jgi:hypothetical protein
MTNTLEIVSKSDSIVNLNYNCSYNCSLEDRYIKRILEIIAHDSKLHEFESKVRGSTLHNITISSISIGFNEDELEEHIKYVNDRLLVKHSKNLVDDLLIGLNRSVNNKDVFEFSLVEDGKNHGQLNFTYIEYKPTTHGHNIKLNYISIILSNDVINMLELLL